MTLYLWSNISRKNAKLLDISNHLYIRGRQRKFLHLLFWTSWQKSFMANCSLPLNIRQEISNQQPTSLSLSTLNLIIHHTLLKTLSDHYLHTIYTVSTHYLPRSGLMTTSGGMSPSMATLLISACRPPSSGHPTSSCTTPPARPLTVRTSISTHIYTYLRNYLHRHLPDQRGSHQWRGLHLHTPG